MGKVTSIREPMPAVSQLQVTKRSGLANAQGAPDTSKELVITNWDASASGGLF